LTLTRLRLEFQLLLFPFSGSAAGEIFWWDLRNLEAPIDTLLLNPKAIVDGLKNDDKAFGVG
jgi:hypothetical protein